MYLPLEVIVTSVKTAAMPRRKKTGMTKPSPCLYVYLSRVHTCEAVKSWGAGPGRTLEVPHHPSVSLGLNGFFF